MPSRYNNLHFLRTQTLMFIYSYTYDKRSRPF